MLTGLENGDVLDDLSLSTDFRMRSPAAISASQRLAVESGGLDEAAFIQSINIRSLATKNKSVNISIDTTTSANTSPPGFITLAALLQVRVIEALPLVLTTRSVHSTVFSHSSLACPGKERRSVPPREDPRRHAPRRQGKNLAAISSYDRKKHEDAEDSAVPTSFASLP